VSRLFLHSLSRLRPLSVAFLFACLILSSACNRGSDSEKEFAYVNAPQVVLRDRLAPIFEKRGTVKLGDKVSVLKHDRRFSYVRTDAGEEGWIADRYLVDSATYSQFEKIVTDNVNTPVQAHGTARATLNLHVAPGRDTEHLFQLKEAAKVEILKRATAEKPGSAPAPAVKKTSEGNAEEEPQPALEDWLLVRASQDRVGWVLSRMVYVDVPLEVAQYAEGQRIVASWVLSKVHDGDKDVPQYLIMLTDSKDGLPFDFNQIRVFTWNVKRHRYETAYREHDLVGLFPAKVGTEDFGKEGVLTVFSFHTKDSQGEEKERKYRMIGPIVRRVATPEELKQESADRAVRRAAEKAAAASRRHKN
jgi:hypothetical protein